MKAKVRGFFKSVLLIKLMVMAITFSLMITGIIPAAETFACDDWEEWDDSFSMFEEENWCDGYLGDEYDDECWDDEWEDDLTYSVDEADQLNGLFALSSDGQTLTRISSETEPGFGIGAYDGSSVDWWLCTVEPFKLYSGEKLVLTGTEWSCRSENDKRDMTIPYMDMHLLGYGNYAMLYDTDTSNFEAVNGVDISGVKWDIDDTNSALSGQNAKFHSYEVADYSSTYEEMLLSSEYMDSVTVGSYSGTDYMSYDVEMYDPVFYHDRCYTSDKELSIEQTHDGYFIIDTSSLPSGVYSLLSWSGEYAFEIL